MSKGPRVVSGLVSAPDANPGSRMAPPPPRGGVGSAGLPELPPLERSPSPSNSSPSQSGTLEYDKSVPPAGRVAGVVPMHESKMSVWKGNPRHFIDPARIDSLAESLKEMGQESPLDVVEDPDKPGHYLILCGQRRWRATKEHGINDGILYIRIRTDLKTESEWYAVAVRTQLETEGLTVIDQAISLAVAPEGSVRELGSMFNKDASEISRLQQIGRLPRIVLSVFERGAEKFSVTFCYEVVHVHKALGDLGAVEFAEHVLSEDWTVKETTRRRIALVEKNDAPSARRQAPVWSVTRTVAIGKVKLSEENRDAQLDLKGIPEERWADFKEAVDRLLAP